MTRIAGILTGALLLAAGQAMAGPGSGAFTGLNGHKTAGGVEVAQTDSGWEVRLQDDFSFDGAPDPRIGFGTGGSFADRTDFEPLHANSGAQVYKVPVGVDPSQYDEVYVWCRQFSVPLGVAKID